MGALEACTGWLFVYEVLAAAGAVGPSGRAGGHERVARQEAFMPRPIARTRWLWTLLAEARLPEAWFPPAHVREWRAKTRLRETFDR